MQPRPPRIGIVAALPRELAALRSDLRRGAIAWRPTTALSAGMGAARAEAAARRLVGQGCVLLVSVGFAAGLVEDVRAAGTVAVQAVIGDDGQRLAAEPLLAALLAESTDASGTCLTVRAPLTDAGAKRALGGSGALVADMETLGVAHAAAALGVPWIGLRAVSDDAHTTLPAPVRRALRPDGSFRLGLFAGAALIQPSSWHDIQTLARDSAAAARRLAAALTTFVESLPWPPSPSS